MKQEIKPELKQAHEYFDEGQWPRAQLAYEVFLQKQDDAFARARLGTILRFNGSLFESLSQFQRAVDLDPANATYQAALGHLQLATGQIEAGLERIRLAVERQPGNSDLFSSYLFSLHYDPQLDSARLAGIHRCWGQLVTQQVRPLPVRKGRYHPQGRIRIGYLGADFKQHSVGYTVGPLFRGHDRRRFEVYGYASVNRVDAMAKQLRNGFDKYRLVNRMDDESLAYQIRADQIDILMAVGGHSFGNRLKVLAYKPAPLQIDYGGINTVGLAQVDVRLTDVRRDPPGSQPYFLEELVYLPEGSTCYQAPGGGSAVGPLPAMKNGYVTFGCCHGAHKMNPRVLALWARVLQTIQGARLLIKCGGGEEPQLQQRIIEALTREGVDATRVTVCGLWSDRSHLDFYHHVDIALDTFPFNGGVTTLEGLWMGVPMISLVGRQTVSRTGLSLLHQIGLEALVLETEEQFVKMATVLASDWNSLAKMRGGMRDRMLASSLCDTQRYVAILDDHLEAIWRRHCHESTG